MSLATSFTRLLAFTALAILTTHAPAGAQLEREHDFVVPDSHYVHRRCAEPQERVNLVQGDAALSALVDHSRIASVVREMTTFCQAYDSAKITADDWLLRFEEKDRELNALTDPCSRTVLCMKIILPPRVPLPKNFTAYSLFVFPSAEWEQHDSKKDVKALQAAFSRFGDSIGDRRAAVWFAKTRYSVLPDISRSKFYCDRFKLNYNDGPFVITSMRRPDEIADRDELVVIRLSGLAAERAVRVLNILEQDLRTDAAIRKRALLYEEIKQRLLSAGDRHPDLVKELANEAIKLLVK